MQPTLVHNEQDDSYDKGDYLNGKKEEEKKGDGKKKDEVVAQEGGHFVALQPPEHDGNRVLEELLGGNDHVGDGDGGSDCPVVGLR